MFEIVFTLLFLVISIFLIKKIRFFILEDRRSRLDAEIDGDFFEEFKNGEAKNDYDIEAVVNWMEEEHLNDQIMKKY